MTKKLLGQPRKPLKWFSQRGHKDSAHDLRCGLTTLTKDVETVSTGSILSQVYQKDKASIEEALSVSRDRLATACCEKHAAIGESLSLLSDEHAHE